MSNYISEYSKQDKKMLIFSLQRTPKATENN